MKKSLISLFIAGALLSAGLAQSVSAATDAAGKPIDGTWAATTNSLEIPKRLYWIYASIKDNQVCMYSLYIAGGCVGKCYDVKAGAFEADKMKYSLTAADKALIESWEVAGKKEMLNWVQYALPAACAAVKK